MTVVVCYTPSLIALSSSMRKHYLLLVLLLVTMSGAFALAPDEPLRFSDDQVATSLDLLEKLGSKHYSSRPVDNALSRDFLDHYLDALDPARLYFLAGDISEFKRRWQTSLDDALKQGDLTPGFDIFNRYRTRALDRLEKNLALLANDEPFDMTVDESFTVDPDDKEWLGDPARLDDYWRKRVKNTYLRLLLADKEPEEARELLVKRFKSQLKRIKSMDSQDAFQLYMNAFTTLYDPHTTYFSPRQLENFTISMSLSLEGIGAVLQVDEENTKVVRIVPGGPADKQGGLSPSDLIVGVAEGDAPMQDVVGWQLDDVVDLIRGPKGTTVRLEIIPAKGEYAGVNREISIVRDQVKLEEQAAKSRVIELDKDGETYKVGVIDIPAFYIDFDAFNRRDPNFKSTTRDVAKLVSELKAQKVDGLIIDLRNNGGGSLHEATTLTDLFITPGPVVQIRYSNQMISRQNRSRSAPLYDGPLLVLINRLSASASEIFAGAIQDYGRGLVVGTQSFGKGTVQALLPLPEGQLKLTESKFYRVSGESTQHRGVVPDIELPSLYNIDEIGESSEDNALPWDKIHGIPVKKHAEWKPLLPELTKRHEKRVVQDPDYVHLVDEITYQENERQQTSVSLNLDKRRQEMAARELSLLAIENKRRVAKGQEPYTDVEAWKKDGGVTGTEEEEFVAEDSEEKDIPLQDDPLLKEAGAILVDAIDVVEERKSRKADSRN